MNEFPAIEGLGLERGEGEMDGVFLTSHYVSTRVGSRVTSREKKARAKRFFPVCSVLSIRTMFFIMMHKILSNSPQLVSRAQTGS